MTKSATAVGAIVAAVIALVLGVASLMSSPGRPPVTALRPNAAAAPVPPGEELTTLKAVRDRGFAVVVASPVSEGVPGQDGPAPTTTYAMRLDQVLWGQARDTFTLTSYTGSAAEVTLRTGGRYLLFLKLGGGIDGAPMDKTIANQAFSVDGDDYVNISPNSALQSRYNRQQANDEVQQSNS